MRSLLLLSTLLLFSACSDSNEKVASKVPATQPLTHKSTSQTTQQKSTPLKTSSPSGHSIYAHKCASCHGLKAEKKALNNSQIIAGWDAKKTTEILKAYQEKSYGGSMKEIMEGQVSTLNEKQIELLSLYISTL